MKMGISRRGFIGGGAAAFSAWLSGCAEKSLDGGRSYSVAVLGDTHYDSSDPKFYHRHYTHSTTKKRYELHLAEHVRNAEMWKERMPGLIRASGACVRDDTVFALQMGDLVQGDCGNAAVHRRMLDDAFGLIKGAYGGRLPLVTVVGNHDIRGDIPEDGAKETFDAWQPPLVAQELGVHAQGTTFSFRQGPDVFIVVDFNEPRPDFALLKRLLAESEGARYTFLVSHGPAIPNCRSRWFLLGSKRWTDERRELRSILARRNAIVLSGHTHLLEWYDCVMPEGRVSQFVFTSVWSKPELSEPDVRRKGAKVYGGKIACTDLADEYRPLIRDGLIANAAGHYRLEVSDERVAVVFYGGASTTPTRTFTLR